MQTVPVQTIMNIENNAKIIGGNFAKKINKHYPFISS